MRLRRVVCDNILTEKVYLLRAKRKKFSTSSTDSFIENNVTNFITIEL